MNAARVHLVSPRVGLIAAVAERLPDTGRDFSRSWVVFPERRPAYYLRKTLAERLGAGFIPPRIDSLDTFVNHVYSERLGRRDRPIDVLDAVALLLEIQRSAPERLGRDRFLTADHFFPLGVKLYHDLEELTSAGVAGEKLRSVDLSVQDAVSGMGSDLLTDRSRARLQNLSYFHEQFTETLAARGLSTPAGRLQAVAEGVDRSLFADADRFIFAGFFSLNKMEEDLLLKLLGWEDFTLLLHQAKGVKALLCRLGLPEEGLAAAANSHPDPEPAITFTKCPDTHGQVFALNTVLRDKLADPSLFHERQVVVLPASETLFPLYQQTLADLHPDEFNISLGYPLTRTPIFTFFERLLDVFRTADEDGRVYAADYLRFVLHPYTKNLYFPGLERRSDLTRILFHAVEEALTERKGRAFWSLAEIETDPAVREAVEKLTRGVEDAPVPAAFLEQLRAVHEALIVPLWMIADIGDFAEKLIRILDYIYVHSTARLHYFFHPYAEAFGARLDGLARSLLRDTVFEDPEGYFNLFRKVAAAGTVPFFGTPLRGLQILGFWETRGIPFEEVYLLDLNEDVLPASKRGDSLLPVGVRQALGLSTHRDLERRIEHYLDVLIRGADRVHLFFVESKDRERSRYVERLLWESRKRDPRRRSETPVGTVRYEVALQTQAPPVVAKSAEVTENLRRFRYSATALDTYLGCSLRFYYRYVLGLKEREDLDEDFEAKDIGNLVHRILEDEYAPFVGRRLRGEDLKTTELEAIVERRFRETFGNDLTGRPYLMMLQTKSHLVEYLEKCQIEILRGLEAEGQTVRLLALEQTHTLEHLGFTLTARFDRLETRGDQLFILDYKTSADILKYGIHWNKLELENRPSWKTAVGSLQMPLYTLILAKAHEKLSEEIQGRFVMLGRTRMHPGIESSPYDAKSGRDLVTPDLRRARIETMERLIDGLLREIIDPALPFTPAAEGDHVCSYCDFKNLCNR
ncbi:MAG: PD-(D/E)XK nuclease family protein [Acidobacteria bacterium]|nr:PD-(D/E)XK nuclease family protein [Acidobacteriota bacterium]